ncbi:MAG: DM13 domain-containing protein, partial [Aquiluna sp.]|nr:DM13 domain-containing protein [Aquiluna sp.]
FAGWHLFDDGEYFSLGKLKGNLGDQNYEIPAELDLERFSSMSIWCVRFAVSFGAAELGPISST